MSTIKETNLNFEHATSMIMADTSAPTVTINTSEEASTTSTKSVHREYDESDEERDLTNLAWLTELRNQTLTWRNVIAPPLDIDAKCNGVSNGSEKSDNCYDNVEKIHQRSNSLFDNILKMKCIKSSKCIDFINVGNARKFHRVSNITKSTTSTVQQSTQIKRPSPTERYEIFLNKIKRDLEEYEQSAVLYQTVVTEKPPFNYSHIIGMAMLEKGRLTLQQICSWIESKFAFFRVRKKWNNSIRHNLSLHHCFRKIDRNKFDKGKGGYWELGLDPKKCDRKRIRNRKASSHSKNKQQLLVKSSKTNKLFTTENEDFESNTNVCSAITTCIFDGCANANKVNNKCSLLEMKEGVGIDQTGEVLLDELDVQQTVDVRSCCSQQQYPQHDIYFANTINNSAEDDMITNESSQLSKDDENNKTMHRQQYQLGTIIITASTSDVIAESTTPTVNCFTVDNQQLHKLCFEDEITSRCENVIVSSYLNKNECDHGGVTDDSADTNTSQQYCHHYASMPYSQRPNVIVEQLEQPATGPYTTASSVSALSTAAVKLVATRDYTTSVVGDNFRPYIDGIEEAFQYLRSMDNNRDDILDNLLDISVSDF